MSLNEEILKGDIEKVKNILNNNLNLNINQQDNCGNTPLHYASCYAMVEYDKTFIFLLLSYGADYTILNSKGENGFYGLEEDEVKEILELMDSLNIKEPAT